jgi:diguanylate cyclase (GGDEF)-like protein
MDARYTASSGRGLLLASLVVALVLVVFDAAMDAYFEHRDLAGASWRGHFYQELFHPSAREVWIRSFVTAVCLGFGVFATLERRRSDRRLAELAYRDPLTDLPNRVSFMERLGSEIHHSRRRRTAFALLFIDLDHFKVVNDSLGHEHGDALLRGVALRLAGSLRPEDLLARLGGDEFVLLARDVSTPFAVTTLARRVMATLAHPFRVGEAELFVTASVGISLFPGDGEDAGTLLKHADAAMYRTKERGRNGFRFYTSDLNARVGERLRIEADLRRALDRGELELDYQPLFSLPGRAIVGAEALLRWRRQGKEVLPPERFMPVADESGLTLALGQWALRTACEQVRAWADSGRGPPCVAVTLWGSQVLQEDFVARVQETIQGSGLAPGALVLEVTEMTLMRDTEQTMEKLASLRALGVRVVLDNFGTGYSSMSHLRHLPVDGLKIDACFVAGIGGPGNEQKIVRAIIALGQSLDLQVVAEGVETAAQLTALEAEGCDLAQGRYLSAPLSAEALAQQLARGGVQCLQRRG